MSGAAQIERDGGTKKKPDQAIYRPGMFKQGIDLTQTKPKAENQPPPSERKLRQMQEKEKVYGSHNSIASASYQNQKTQHRPQFHQRERNFSESYQYGSGYHRNRGGGGNFRRDNFDSRSVRSNKRRNNYRNYRNRAPVDTVSEMGNNDDNQSIASTTFSTDTSIYGNGFASEFNSRHTSVQSLLSADLPNFDWAEALDDNMSTCLENLPEVENQEDDIISEKTPTDTPRKFSVNSEVINDNISQKNDEPSIEKITEKMDELSTSNENESLDILDKVEKKQYTSIDENKQILRDKNNSSPFSLKIMVSQTLNSLKDSMTKMQSIYGISNLSDISENEMIEFLNNKSTEYRTLIQNLCYNLTEQNKQELTSDDIEEFKNCALDIMKIQQTTEKAIQIITIRKNNHILSIVIDIIVKSLYVISILLIYNLEQSKKYQLIDSFEGIWSKLISKVKKQVTSFGKNLVMHLITFIRSIISTLSEYMKIDEYLNELIKIIQTTDYKDFGNSFVFLKDNALKLFQCSDSLLNFSSYIFRWQGDLVRYQVMILGSTDYDPCLNFYYLSFICDPTSGTSLNQMGAVASYKSSRRKSLARRRNFCRNISVIDENQTSSDLLNALYLFSHALTTSRPFIGSEMKLNLLLNSNDEYDSNAEKTEFIKKFLFIANKIFLNEKNDINNEVDDFIKLFDNICNVDNELNILTSSDIIYQIGIYWNLLCLDKIKIENKLLLKKLLLNYFTILIKILLTIDDILDDSEIEKKLLYLTPSISLLCHLFNEINCNEISDLNLNLTEIINILNNYSSTNNNEIYYVTLPELLLMLNGYKNNSFKNLFYESTISDIKKSGITVRLSVIINFLEKLQKT